MRPRSPLERSAAVPMTTPNREQGDTTSPDPTAGPHLSGTSERFDDAKYVRRCHRQILCQRRKDGSGAAPRKNEGRPDQSTPAPMRLDRSPVQDVSTSDSRAPATKHAPALRARRRILLPRAHVGGYGCAAPIALPWFPGYAFPASSRKRR